MEKLNFVTTDPQDEHLIRHLSPDSLTIGSKLLDRNSHDDVAKILETTDKAYESLIEEPGGGIIREERSSGLKRIGLLGRMPLFQPKS